MKRPIALLAVLSAVLIAAPAGADVDVYAACTNVGGATVVTPADGFNGTVTTPVGALNLGTEPAGNYILDLVGKPIGSRGSVTMTLSWDPTPAPVSDYDLVVNGENALSTDFPEVHGLTSLPHCTVISLETSVFVGAPIDTLTLDVDAS